MERGGEEIQNGKKERAERAMTHRISPERCAATHSRPCCTQIVIYFWDAICCVLEAHPQASSDDRLFISMMILQTSIDDFGIVECRPRPATWRNYQMIELFSNSNWLGTKLLNVFLWFFFFFFYFVIFPAPGALPLRSMVSAANPPFIN
jgi:hypothetical protein